MFSMFCRTGAAQKGHPQARERETPHFKELGLGLRGFESHKYQHVSLVKQCN